MEEKKVFETKEFLKAIEVIKKERGEQYAEDCVKAVLKAKLITVDQYSEAMELIYN